MQINERKPSAPPAVALVGLSVLILGLTTGGCAGSAPSDAGVAPDPDLERLAYWMTGSFSSATQAERDGDYYEVTMHMIRIWPEREDGYWLYVEQAVKGGVPYRQRIYHLLREPGERIESRIYTALKVMRFRGAWADPTLLDELTFEQLTLREGCGVELTATEDGSFEGGTEGKGCPSKMRGASYAVSKITITSDTVISWDRGYDSSDEQVWGSEKEGYVFDKLEDFPL